MLVRGVRPSEQFPSLDHPGRPRSVGVHLTLPLADVARELLAARVDAVLVFDEDGAIGRLSSRELARAVAVGADPQIATAEDFMAPLDVGDDPFWSPHA